MHVFSIHTHYLHRSLTLFLFLSKPKISEQQEEDILLEEVQGLKGQLYDLTVEREQIETFKERVHTHAAVRATNFAVDENMTGEEGGWDGSDNLESRTLPSLFTIRDGLLSDTMELHNQLEELRRQRSELQVESQNIKKSNRSLWREVHEEATAASALPLTQVTGSGAVAEDMKRMEEALLKEEHENTMLRNIVQSMVIASETDWAQDPSMMDLMMNLHDFPGVGEERLQVEEDEFDDIDRMEGSTKKKKQRIE